ncbi:hypothetical protein N0V87_005502 [Didymella glomerata]|uniref:Heterokaryon incompatibility domain-containing protein n=1 Tax=Didymella glomerata TaxID=749621 RepID=A0A9W9BZR9_9PLEO|nr:hypothetical protein N0V87_005502 [Didymella glomerata]
MDSTSQITSNERLYQHTPLREHTSTRLLSLLPGEHGTPLQCEIIECEDNFNTAYEALSYTWGEPEFPKVIHVNDSSGKLQYIRITQNLYNALERLRKVDAPRSMWIDALCIDQADLQEKGHQVAHMGQIFSRADRVVIWLGDTGDFPLFETWVEQDMMRKSMKGKPMSRCGFLDIPWFYRVWTVQELVLAEDACFCLGHLEVPLRKMEGIIIGALVESEDVRRHGLDSLFTYRDQIRGSGPEYRRPAENIPLTLARCFLGLARRRQCKDGRDRIYGMHGLLPDNDFSHKLKSVGDYYKLAETHIAAWSEECLTSQEDLELNKGLLERPLGVISRTLCMDDFTHYTHKMLFALSLFSDLSPSLFSIDKQRWADRSLFFTTTGFLGLGPRGLQPGDEVVIFDGDYTPFILRPQLDTNNPNGNLYKIVGDCYLEGWMYDTFPDENVDGPLNHWTGADSEPQRAFKWVSGREGMQDEMPRLEERTFTIC